jgi:hypothetical protein
MKNRTITLLILLFSFIRSQGQLIFFSTDSAAVNEGNSITFNIELSSASTSDVSVDLSVSGGTAYGTGYMSAQGEVFGTGKDYSIITGKLTIPAGTTKLTLSLTTVDDILNENDENLQLELSNPVNATLTSPGSLTVTIIDNDRANLMNVKTQFGAKGDGSADDTQAIQNAIDSLSDEGGGVLLFPAGLYIVSSVKLRENITYEGYGATIKRPDNMDKWTRTFVAYYSGDQDSKPYIIKGFSFDGNSPNQAAYKHWELEQAHLVMIYGDTSRSGHCIGFVEDCMMKNGVGDGVSVYTNADATIYNCEATDVFRGGFVVTGGHSKVKVYKFTTHAGAQKDPTGLDIEVDGAGHGNDYKIDVIMDGVNCIDGDFDVGTQGGTVTANNCFSSGTFYNFAGGGKSAMKFINCSIAIGGADSYQRILWPGNLTFENCTFTISKFSSAASGFYGFDLWWNYPGDSIQYRDQSVTFKNCSFQTDRSLMASDEVQAIHTKYDSPSNNNILTIEGNSSISNAFDKGLFMEDGGKWIIRNLQNDAKLALYIPGAGRIGDISIDGMTVTGSKYATITQNADYHTLSQQNIQLSQASNYITAVKGLEKISISGSRIITGTVPPDSSTHGFLNDLYHVGSQEWKCTKAGYSKGSGTVYSKWASTDTLAQTSQIRMFSSVMLYPNPVRDILILSFTNQVTDATVSIFDIQGCNVLSHVCNNTMNETIDVGGLSNGMYYIMVRNGNETMNARFVK